MTFDVLYTKPHWAIAPASNEQRVSRPSRRDEQKTSLQRFMRLLSNFIANQTVINRAWKSRIAKTGQNDVFELQSFDSVHSAKSHPGYFEHFFIFFNNLKFDSTFI
jgi:hypothetical protein